MNYNMNNMKKSILDLQLMLKTTEHNVKKIIANVLMVQKGKALEKNGKGKAKMAKIVMTVTKPMEQVKPHATSTSQSQKEKKKRKKIVISAMHLGIGSKIASSTLKI
ncbi:hypothetical protein Scep_014593 [Stephania cephalantha]|uniref:Uncharacterized protein n=1 Tax=Stephania cephalantha TaxID=152367 RepID=A0AAP0J3M0_9MAGN